MVAVNPRNTDNASSIHGIPMTEEAFEHLISLESPYRYELIDGLVYDMTGSSPEHADIADNISRIFKDQLGRQGPCRVYQEQYVFIPSQPSVVPDVVVTCDLADRDKAQRLKPFKIRSPLIVAEVLSFRGRYLETRVGTVPCACPPSPSTYGLSGREMNGSVMCHPSADRRKALSLRGESHTFFQIPTSESEVLSPSTTAYDHAEKFARYRHCPTLEVYMLASQNEQYIEVYRKTTGWKQERYVLEETVQLDQLDLELPLALVYEGVF